MRATVMYGANDVRIEHVPDARLSQPTDVLAGEITPGGVAAYIEDAAKYSIFGRR